MEKMYESVAQQCSFFTKRPAFLQNSPETECPTCQNCRYMKNNYCMKEVFDPIKNNLKG